MRRLMVVWLGTCLSLAASGSAALTATVPALPASAASAADTPASPLPLPRQVVTGSARDDAAFGWRSNAAALARQRSSTNDSARLLQDVPGMSLYGAGGVSSLPAIHGLADDRLRTQVDGMDLVAACPNHMNPVLSYMDAGNVGSIKVFSGIAPVSVGGDSIGGTIQVEGAAPEFASPGEAPLVRARLSAGYRSNGHSRNGGLTATYATETLSATVTATTVRQRNFRAAAPFKPATAGSETGPVIPGDEVASSAFEASNGELRLAWRESQHLVQLSLGRQRIGFEGFPNQRMDMTDNRGDQANLRYTGQFDWGKLTARVWQQDVHHAMDMGPDRFFYGFGMPMLTQATTRGTQLQVDVNLREDDVLRVGAERHTYVLYDWWPPVGGSMGPNAFWNVDDGLRLRTGAFAEWEGRWAPALTTRLGLRGDHVVTDAATVQGYDNGLGAIWGNEAAAFNRLRHRRRDDLLDLALTARYQPDPGQAYELGWARKGHAPNLYQRYPWSTQPMAALMNNFVGDGNGYVGNPDLRPETAHTVALSGSWQDAAGDDWSLKASAYLTRVHDFMDARRCDFGQCSAANATMASGFVLLQYANAPARLRGLDLSGHYRLLHASGHGDVSASFVLNVVRGRNLASGDGLYNLMPLNLKVALEHRWGGWTGALEWQVVAAKRRVSAVRNELATPGYGLAHLRASYEWTQARLDFGVDNLLNHAYMAPLGGAYLGQGRSMTSAGVAWGVGVPGPGRSFNTSFSLWF